MPLDARTLIHRPPNLRRTPQRSRFTLGNMLYSPKLRGGCLRRRSQMPSQCKGRVYRRPIKSDKHKLVPGSEKNLPLHGVKMSGLRLARRCMPFSKPAVLGDPASLSFAALSALTYDRQLSNERYRYASLHRCCVRTDRSPGNCVFCSGRFRG